MKRYKKVTTLPDMGVCKECGAAAVAKSLCATHYRAQREGRPLHATRASPGTSDAVKVSFRCPEALRAAVEAAAQREGIDASEWWRRAASERLSKKK